MEEEQEMNTREQGLKFRLDKMVAHKVRKPKHSVNGVKGICFTFIFKNLCLLFMMMLWGFKFDSHSLSSLGLILPQHECEEEVEKHEEKVGLFRETYDKIVDEDGVCWLLAFLKHLLNIYYTVNWQYAILYLWFLSSLRRTSRRSSMTYQKTWSAIYISYSKGDPGL